MESFGFPEHFHKTLHEFPICHVNALLAGTLETSSGDPEGGRIRLLLMYRPVEYNYIFEYKLTILWIKASV